jgi:outer membrane protein assembly factor BamB
MRIRSGQIVGKLLETLCCFLLLMTHSYAALGDSEPRNQYIELQGFAFGISVSPSGDADVLFMAGHKSVCAVDAKTGKVMWSAQIPSGTIDSPPLIVGDVVLYSGGGGNFTLYALNAKTGHLQWKQDHKSTVFATDGHAVFVNEVPGKSVLAFSARSGRQLWRFEHVGPDTVGQIAYYQKKLFTNYDVLDAASGKLIQQLPTQPRTLTAASGRLFAASPDETIQALDASSMKILWTAQTTAGMNPVAIKAHEDYVIAAFYQGYEFGAHHGLLRAYSSRDGRQLWEVPLTTQEQGLLPNPIAIDDKYAYVSEPSESGRESRISALDLDGGRVAWSYDELEGTDGPPVPFGDKVYISVGDRRLLVLDRSTGKQLRKISSPDPKD